MMERLGPEKAEALRQQVLREQTEAREKFGRPPDPPRDRDTYKDYPTVKLRSPRKMVVEVPKSKRRKK